ncbi:MAG: reverse transcriptase domain-containing protein [Bacillota bacterium]
MVLKAKEHIEAGNTWVVDIDLARYFDTVNHDKLMRLVARKVKDKRVLKLARAYLNSGVMINGVVVEVEEGCPQGGPLSPLLKNIMLDELDKELEKRGHKFCRCADDGIAHCSTLNDAKALQDSLKQRFEECGLELHPEKIRIIYCKDDDRKGDYPEISFDFLGYTFRPRKSKNWKGKHFINFTPAVSNKAKKAISPTSISLITAASSSA